ncbi:zinc finger protein 541-like [Patagioenas fasciata]|uniref:zinc finger protein 541-like n=1 Tax=Patagioenas fasciata TaxID=372321 RepID=UPI003A9A52CF
MSPAALMSRRNPGNALLFRALAGRLSHSAASRSESLWFSAEPRGFGADRSTMMPQINVGSGFQAELPALRDPAQAQQDEERAELVWKPWGYMDTDPQAPDPGIARFGCLAHPTWALGGSSLLLGLPTLPFG